MANIQELRKKYPQYDDLNNMDFADKFHNKFYSDIPKDDFYKKIGVNNNFIDHLANNSGVNSVLGAGDALRNQLANVANLVPGVNIPMAQSSEGTAYNIGNFVGNTAGYIAGGELLAPTKIGQIALKGLGNMGRRIAGGGAYGAVQDSEDRLKGAAFGAGTAGLGETVTGLGGSLVKKFQPERQAQELLKYLGGGQSLSENAKIVSEMIQKSGKLYKEKGSDVYGASIKQPGVADLHILDKLERPGTQKAYQYVDGKKQYLPKFELDIPNPSKDLSKFIKSFEKNPTALNAHELQSQLGAEASGIKTIDMASGATKKAYKNARIQLQDKLDQKLQSVNPKIAEQYREAGEFHKQYVAPYTENKAIRDIMSGATENPNLNTLFRRPNIKRQQILENLGAEGKNRVLYSSLNLPDNSSAKSLVNSWNQLEKRGLSSPVSERSNEMVTGLNNAISRQATMHRMLSAIPLFASGKMSGVPGLEILGAVVGMTKGPQLANQMKLPKSEFHKTLSDLLGKGYGTSIKSITANEPLIRKNIAP